MELYQSVCEKLDGKEELMNASHCSKISMMQGEISENVYLLILHHFCLKNKTDSEDLISGKEFPYSSKTASKEGKGINFKLSNLPEDLQRIIVRYLSLISLRD